MLETHSVDERMPVDQEDSGYFDCGSDLAKRFKGRLRRVFIQDFVEGSREEVDVGFGENERGAEL
jgi:hypothetical protein